MYLLSFIRDKVDSNLVSRTDTIAIRSSNTGAYLDLVNTFYYVALRYAPQTFWEFDKKTKTFRNLKHSKFVQSVKQVFSRVHRDNYSNYYWQY